MWLPLQVALLFVNCLVLHLRLRLSCDRGYAPDGNTTRTCLASNGDAQGVWSNQRPICKRKWNVLAKNSAQKWLPPTRPCHVCTLVNTFIRQVWSQSFMLLLHCWPICGWKLLQTYCKCKDTWHNVFAFRFLKVSRASGWLYVKLYAWSFALSLFFELLLGFSNILL